MVGGCHLILHLDLIIHISLLLRNQRRSYLTVVVHVEECETRSHPAWLDRCRLCALVPFGVHAVRQPCVSCMDSLCFVILMCLT